MFFTWADLPVQCSSTSHSPLLLRHNVPSGENYKKTHADSVDRFNNCKKVWTTVLRKYSCPWETRRVNTVTESIVTNFCVFQYALNEKKNTYRAIRVEIFINYIPENNQQLFSPYSINTFSSIQVIIIEKIVNSEMMSWCNTKFS